MDKNDMKRVIDNLKPDKEMEERLRERILQKQRSKFVLRPIVSIAAGFVIVICLGIAGYNFVEKGMYASPPETNTTDGIYIPKIELPKETNVALDMIGLFMYQGRVYTQTGTKISSESAENLLGEKLGTTKGNIDEWSLQDDYAVEFASSIGKMDVYTVKGYDKSFRTMTYEKIGGVIYAEFYECLNGITVKTGADIFDKLKLENNVKAAKYEDYDSWNYGKEQYIELSDLTSLNNFVYDLKNTIPYTQESLSYLFDENGEINQKFIAISLNDGSEVHLRLFINGYVYYSNSHIFFKMENPAFNELWKVLE